MTREEAISEWTFRSNHIKKWLDEYGEEPSIRHYVELIDMAIEALSADTVSFETQVKSTRQVLDDFAKDRVKVVRCKDCRWFKQDSSPVGYGYCDGRMVGREVDYNDYCSYGEREVNGFKSVGQAWNTSQERWEK